jgi:hypothetical protein
MDNDLIGAAVETADERKPARKASLWRRVGYRLEWVSLALAALVAALG